MLSRLLCRASGAESCSLSRTLFARYLPPTISASSRPKSTCVLRFTRSGPLNPVSKRLVSNLSSSVSKQNGATLLDTKRSTNINLDLDTNVLNNVFLFKYVKPAYFRAMNVFAVFQLLFWMGISYFTCKELPAWDAERTTIRKYINDNFITILIASTAVAVGFLSAVLIWTFTARSVKYLILHKGGKDVTFVTYHPLNRKCSITVPVNRINCSTYRRNIKNYLPLKMEGRKFFYILDRDGEYVNPELFDHTVGQLRKTI